MPEQLNNEENSLREVSPTYRVPVTEDGDGDLLMADSLAMTPWERILANDDMINFGDSLRAAMEKRNAKPR